MKFKSNKILIVCNSNFAYEKFIKETVEYLKKKKINSSLIIGERKKNFIYYYTKMPSGSFFSYFYFFIAAYKIYKIIKLNSFSLVVHNNRNASICSRLAMFFVSRKIKSIYFSRGMYFHDNQNLIKYLLSFAL